LVDHALILPALDPGGLRGEVVAREELLRARAAHHASRAVRAGAVRVGVALAAHDEAARAHRAGNDAELALARAHRALARDPHALAEMLLDAGVVVVAVRDLAHEAHGARERLLERAVHEVEHEVAVE